MGISRNSIQYSHMPTMNGKDPVLDIENFPLPYCVSGQKNFDLNFRVFSSSEYTIFNKLFGC